MRSRRQTHTLIADNVVATFEHDELSPYAPASDSISGRVAVHDESTIIIAPLSATNSSGALNERDPNVTTWPKDKK
jgi:hypothetical protein